MRSTISIVLKNVRGVRLKTRLDTKRPNSIPEAAPLSPLMGRASELGKYVSKR